MRQARNSAAFWAATGEARGHDVVSRRAFLAVVGDERSGTRVLIQEPGLEAEEVAEINDLAVRAVGPVDVEDPYSSTDLSQLGLRSWQMPVMVRPPGPAAQPPTEVRRVRSEGDLYAAEQIVIGSFELTTFEPHRPAELFPASLIDHPGIDVFLAIADGRAAGACVVVAADGLGSHYWVGTPAVFRSRGIGRAVMLASINYLHHLPLTLTASKLGRPLYESLGYTVAGTSTWYSSR
ncbi:hypothetical protein [Dactylosporangium sp. NPDC048998]|uniref:hypothetical protein n=1 Tax=Dactylosporangium sp. NPDC048998 TaxID=3363976 RepID=UPI0037193D0F